MSQRILSGTDIVLHSENVSKPELAHLAFLNILRTERYKDREDAKSALANMIKAIRLLADKKGLRFRSDDGTAMMQDLRSQSLKLKQ